MSFWSTLSNITDTVSNIAGYSTPTSIKTYAETAEASSLFSELTLVDSEWTLSGGSATENQVFYITTKAGGFAFVQLIHSNIGQVLKRDGLRRFAGGDICGCVEGYGFGKRYMEMAIREVRPNWLS
ncbi:hypothetical protein BC938DRAFT_480424 [Jimgerdemannia flammicorona]|uniref:Svf1-like N-terminal domain-containing protein n=1 Tax=Jimgerdemannia flammicorona TaxID=994334 RepID=A0A433QIQ0_9FUNG|nr:hypothetical protein BC938DRAFT_480424 [Jimgerdemannia flammicorona]